MKEKTIFLIKITLAVYCAVQIFGGIFSDIVLLINTQHFSSVFGWRSLLDVLYYASYGLICYIYLTLKKGTVYKPLPGYIAAGIYALARLIDLFVSLIDRIIHFKVYVEYTSVGKAILELILDQLLSLIYIAGALALICALSILIPKLLSMALNETTGSPQFGAQIPETYAQSNETPYAQGNETPYASYGASPYETLPDDASDNGNA